MIAILPMAGSRPRLDELEARNPRDSSEISAVVGDENDPRFTTRQRQEDVVAKRLRDPAQLQSFASHEL